MSESSTGSHCDSLELLAWSCPVKVFVPVFNLQELDQAGFDLIDIVLLN